MYNFTLKFRLANSQADPHEYIDCLYENGCDDALIGIGKKGSIALDFTREASTAFQAVSSAITDVKTAIPDALLIEASPDFVGLTDVADLFGCSRQNIRNLIVNSEINYPAPVYEGKPTIWHLNDLLLWLKEHKSYSFDDSILEIAETNRIINLAKDWRSVKPELQENIKSLAI